MNKLRTGFLLTLLTFSTHPRTEECIQRLQGSVGIR